MKRSSTFGLRLFTSMFLILFTFAQPLLAIESLIPVEDAATTVDESKDILPTGVSDPSWITSGESATTSLPVVTGITYEYPINPAVTVTFSKLPSTSSTLTIKTIYLTDEQVKATNASSNVAYDITTDMVDGTFKYDLTLPKTGDSKKVVYAENVNELAKDNVKDISNVVDNGKSLKIEDLNHFTIFVVTLPNPVSTDCSASGLTVSVGDRCYNTIQEAVDSAVAGDTIRVNTGTYVLNSVVNMDTPNVTLMGIGNPVIQVSGTGYRFVMSANGNTISGFNIQKTDKTGEQNIIWINANDISITNNQISGQFVIGDPEVSRAMVISGGHSGLLIQNNTIHNLRQPAYISGVTTGNILNNYVYSTKGWVVEQGNMTFTNNTWGTGVNTNVYDIAILSATSSSYYTNVSSLSEANNDAVIEDQRVSPAVLSDVYVDESTAYTSDLGGRFHPYSSIVPALARVAAGGTIHFLSDVHVASRFNINKALTLDGNNHSIYSTFTKTDNSNNAAISIAHDDVTLKNLTVDGISSTNLHGINIYVAKNILLDKVTVQNNGSAGIVVNGSTVTVNNITTSNNTWGGINLDLGGGVTTEAKLTVLGTSHHTEFKAIWMDDIRKAVSVVDTTDQYDSVDNGFTRVLYLRIGTPINLGWNVASKSTTPNETPLDLTCSTGTVYTNENSVSQNWSSVSGLNIKYQREVTFPTGGISYFDAGSITNTPFATFGSSTGIEGLWKTRVRAYIDSNSNNTLDSYEGRSQWSNYCNITLDKTRPTVNVVNPVADQSFKGNVKIDISASDAQTGIQSASMHIYKVVGAVKTLVSGCTSIPTIFDGTNWTATINNGGSCNLSEGRYEIAAWAYDLAGNPNWAPRVQFNVDTTAPSGSIDSLYYVVGAQDYTINNFKTNSNSPMFKGTYSDNVGVASINIALNGYNQNLQFTNGTWTSPAFGQVFPDGTYPVTLTLTDFAGNVTVVTKDVVIDTQAPTATYTHFKDGIAVLGAQAFVKNVSQLSFTGAYTDSNPSSGLYQDSFVIFQAQNDGSFAFSQNGKLSYCGWRQAPNLVTLSGNPFTLTTQRQFTDCVATLPDGTYYMAHQVYDNATRKDIPSINQFRDVLGLKFTVDNLAPVSQFIQTQANTYHNSGIVINGTSTDSNGVTGVDLYYRISGTGNTWGKFKHMDNSSNSNTFVWPTTTWTPPFQGTFDVKAEATDQAGNTEHSPEMDNIVFDTRKPTFGNIQISQDYFGRYVNGYNGFNISVLVNDTLSGINNTSCQYTLNNGHSWNTGTYTASSCTFSVPSSILFNSEDLDIQAKIQDNAGNSATSRVTEREVDKEYAKSKVNIADHFYGPNDLPLIAGTASDSVSNVTDVNITMQRSSDNRYWVGNSSWSSSFGTQNTILFGENWVLAKLLPSSMMDNGVTYTVTPYAWDQVQDTAIAGTSDSFIWDSQNPIDPTVSSTSHTLTPNRDKTIDISFSGANDGNGSGVSGYYYSFSHTQETPNIGFFNWLSADANHVTSRPLSDGVWYFNIRTIDNVGNITSTTHAGPFVIDTTAPTVPTNGLPNNSIIPTNNFDFTWNASTDASALTYEFQSSMNPTQSGGVLTTGLWKSDILPTAMIHSSGAPDGTWYWQVRAKDAAGNYSNWSNIWNVTLDTVAPTTPTNLYFMDLDNAKAIQCNGYSNTKHVSEYWNPSEDANLDHYEYSSYNAPDGSAGLTSSIMPTNSFDSSWWTIPSEGTYGFQVRAVDKAGNMSPWALVNDSGIESSCKINIDWTAPVTTISGTDSLWHKTDVTAGLTCSDDGSECAKTFYSLNGSEYTEGDSVVISSEGENTVSYYSIDNAGNSETSKDVVIKIDKTNPELAILNPSVTLPIAGIFAVNGTVSDSLSDVKKVTLDFGSGITSDAVLGASTWSLDVNNGTFDLADGTYNVTVTAEDNSGNTTVKTLTGLVVDNTKPEAQVLAALSFTTGDTTPRLLALSDNTDLDQVCYTLDANPLVCTPITGILYNWNVTSLINTLGVGSHIFTYYVVDKAGNQSDSNTVVTGNNPYAASIVVAAVPQAPEGQVQGATTEETTPPATETTSPVTTPNTEEVKGAQDTNTDTTKGKTIPWWIYVIGGATLLAFIIFLIARRRKEEEEKEKNIK